MPEPVRVTVLVVTWQGAHLLPDCLDSLAAQRLPHRVLVIDNGSTDGTRELLVERYPDVAVLALDTNTGFAGGVAAGLQRVDTPLVALLNNDAKAEPEWLSASVRVLDADQSVAGVSARMLAWPASGESDEAGQAIPADGVINNAGVRLTADGYGTDRGGGEPDGPPYDRPAEVFGVSGGAAVLRTAAVREVGGMPGEFFLYYEDTDLSWRLRLAGHGLRYEPTAVVRHRHAASTDRASELFAYCNERNRLLMLLRCAPWAFFARQLGRFVLTTASLTGKRLLRRPVPDHRVFDPRLRARVLFGVLRLARLELKARKSVYISPATSRRAVLGNWVGRSGELS